MSPVAGRSSSPPRRTASAGGRSAAKGGPAGLSERSRVRLDPEGQQRPYGLGGQPFPGGVHQSGQVVPSAVVGHPREEGQLVGAGPRQQLPDQAIFGPKQE